MEVLIHTIASTTRDMQTNSAGEDSVILRFSWLGEGCTKGFTLKEVSIVGRITKAVRAN